MNHFDSSDAGVSATNKYTVLVAEDDDDVRRVVVRMVFRLGYHVLSAATGVQAIKVSRLYNAPIHLLLSDVVLPGMSGPQTAQQIRTARPNIKILYMSAHDNNDLSEYLDRDDFARFLKKPFSAAQLALQLQRLLDHS